MQEWIIGLAVLLVLLLVAIAALLYLAPGKLVAWVQSRAASSAGLAPKALELGSYTVHYLEGGTGEPIVLLHGMADEKNSFAPAAGRLTAHHRVLLPDLQGHGENARDPARDYSIRGQVEYVDAFVTALGLDTFVLGGNSMGGHVAAAYALAHPDKVEKLVLVNAPGLQLDDKVVYGGFPEPMRSRDDFHALMARVVVTPPRLPGPIVDFMVERSNADFDFVNAMAASVRNGEDFDLAPRVGSIGVPTLILWGEADAVVGFDVAEGYDRLVPGSELVVLPNVGHSPQIEKPAEVGEAIGRFVDGS